MKLKRIETNELFDDSSMKQLAFVSLDRMKKFIKSHANNIQPFEITREQNIEPN
jgi:hypothetical protein